MVEYFAGHAAVTKTLRKAGKKAVAIDLAYDDGSERPGAMNILTDSGMALPVCSVLMIAN